jgi:HPt (histidine-containing phosphotransfer) domain-containing protein
MTANAFREDMELCFDAGMDDFLSKPVTLQRLAAVLAKWIVQAPEAEETAEPEIVDTGDPVNRAVLAELLGGADDALLDEMLAAFRSAAMDSWSEVERALGAGDPVQLGKAAHGAKGEARSAGAVALGNLYERLENAARERDMILARTLSDQLRREVDRVVAFIKQPAMESSA